MKLKHLNYIRNLLWNAEWKARRLYEASESAYQSAVEFDLDTLEKDRALRDELLEDWTVAKEALELFEAREWW